MLPVVPPGSITTPVPFDAGSGAGVDRTSRPAPVSRRSPSGRHPGIGVTIGGSRRAGSGPAPSVRWGVFSFRMGAATPRVRAVVWRRLHRVGALNLGPGRWAVRAGRCGLPDLGRIIDEVRSHGGETTYGPPPDGHGGGVAARQLDDACERLWDEFFNACDRVERGRARSGDPGDLEDLRHLFRSTVHRDIARCGGGARADRRLRDLHDRMAPMSPGDGGGALAGRPALGAPTEWLYSDGTVEVVADLVPAPPGHWDHAFLAFEEVVYRPDPTRPVLAHGTFRFTCALDAVESEMVSVGRRLAAFSASR